MLRRLLVVVICVGICVPATLPCRSADEGVKLAYKFKQGELLRYKMVADMTISMQSMGGQQVPSIGGRIVGVFRQRTRRVLPNGDAEIAVAIESMRMDMTGVSQEMPVKSMPVVTMTMSRTGAVRNVEGLEKMMAACRGMPFADFSSLTQYSAFPEAGLKVGDTWTQNIPFPMGGTLQSKVELLSLSERLGEYTVAKLDSRVGGDFSFSMELPLGGQAGSSPAMDMKGTLASNGFTYFSPEKGKLVRTEGTLDMVMSMSMVGQPAGADSPGDMKTNMRMTFEMFLLPGK